MQINEEIFRRRMNQFDEPIQELAMHNPLIHHIIKMYAHGEIITKEEALCQMVVGLGKHWSEIQEESFKAAMSMSAPIFMERESKAP